MQPARIFTPPWSYGAVIVSPPSSERSELFLFRLLKENAEGTYKMEHQEAARLNYTSSETIYLFDCTVKNLVKVICCFAPSFVYLVVTTGSVVLRRFL